MFYGYNFLIKENLANVISKSLVAKKKFIINFYDYNFSLNTV